MKTILHPIPNRLQRFFKIKASFFFILLLAGSFSVKAQVIPFPLSNHVSYIPTQPNTFNITRLSPVLLPTVPSGTWTALANSPSYASGGGMLLLSDGTVLAKSGGGGGQGTIYNKLTPDASGSYINGTWSTIAPMHNDRLYYSTQLLKDGRVYVAGGEYGAGGSHGEVYDPLTNVWTLTPDPGQIIYDANSEILDD